MKVAVVIPAYNESAQIIKVIKMIRKKSLPIIVVDDGSIDNTYELVKSEKVDVLLSNERNKGKGKSLKKAFMYLKENYSDIEGIIIMDADAQHLPEELDLFLDGLRKGSFFIVGNRFHNAQNMPLIRRLTNIVMSSIISLYAKQKIPDTQCGFKAFKKDVLDKIEIKTDKYEIDSELILEAALHGYKIDSVPVQSVYKGENSSIQPLRDTVRFLSFILRRR